MTDTVVLLSGGIDSAVVLAWATSRGRRPRCLSVDYGQSHRRELAAAAAVAAAYGVPHEVAAVSPRLLAGSALTGGGVIPHGHYADPAMRATVVPARNLLLLAMAAAAAVRDGAGAVAYGCHAGDHPVYPDCRPEFADAAASALALCDYRPISLDRPLVGMTKAQVVGLGVALGAPLGLTWSCYEGGDVHCGRCGTCVERREAFAAAGSPDPTEYRA